MCRAYQRPRLVPWHTEAGTGNRGRLSAATTRWHTRAMARRIIPNGTREAWIARRARCTAPRNATFVAPRREPRRPCHRRSGGCKGACVTAPGSRDGGSPTRRPGTSRAWTTNDGAWRDASRVRRPAWDKGRILDGQAITTLVALAWVTTGLFDEMGVPFFWQDGPGFATQAILSRSASDHEAVPSTMAACLHARSPPGAF